MSDNAPLQDREAPDATRQQNQADPNAPDPAVTPGTDPNEIETGPAASSREATEDPNDPSESSRRGMPGYQ